MTHRDPVRTWVRRPPTAIEDGPDRSQESEEVAEARDMAARLRREPTPGDDNIYARHHDILGPLQEPPEPDARVRYRPVMDPSERSRFTALVIVNALAGLFFLGWLVAPGHLPTPDVTSGWLWLARVGFVLIVVVEIVRITQGATLWFFGSRAVDPVPWTPPEGLRVAILTTIVPGSEPLEVVAQTLAAMRRIAYPGGHVDVWILDEGDDDTVKAAADELGVRHFSRAGRPEYNQEEGPFRAKTKHGNHNAWRAEHEDEYDVVMQADPDHVPRHDFLIRSLGYFRDPDVAFVVAPQVYGNLDEGFVPHAAASQSYLFHGLIQRGANGWGAPLLIGTNHIYRVAAWKQVGGYQDSVIEDHLTSLAVHATENPRTGRRWKGVYAPDILSIGEGPGAWSDYFKQQKRWAYGVWEVMLRHSRKLRNLTVGQRLSYALLQFFYPSVGIMWFLGNLLTGLYLAFGIVYIELDLWYWVGLWTASVATQMLLFFWSRRFNLVEHERRELALDGVALSVMTSPVYVAAGLAAIVGRPLKYEVTSKGEAAESDTIGAFRLHLAWAAGAIALLVASWAFGNEYAALRAWITVTLTVSLAPIAIFLWQRRRRSGA